MAKLKEVLELLKKEKRIYILNIVKNFEGTGRFDGF